MNEVKCCIKVLEFDKIVLCCEKVAPEKYYTGKTFADAHYVT